MGFTPLHTTPLVVQPLKKHFFYVCLWRSKNGPPLCFVNCMRGGYYFLKNKYPWQIGPMTPLRTDSSAMFASTLFASVTSNWGCMLSDILQAGFHFQVYVSGHYVRHNGQTPITRATGRNHGPSYELLIGGGGQSPSPIISNIFLKLKPRRDLYKEKYL